MITTYDFLVLDFIQDNIVNPILTPILELFTRIGNSGLIWILIGIGLLCFRKTRIMGFGLLICLLIENTICSHIIKPIIARPRPYVQNPDIVMMIPKLNSYSFPSGHSASSFCSAVYIYGWNKKTGIIALAAAFLIAFSRLYFYMHFPTDVLCGSLLGILIGYLCAKGFKYLKFNSSSSR